ACGSVSARVSASGVVSRLIFPSAKRAKEVSMACDSKTANGNSQIGDKAYNPVMSLIELPHTAGCLVCGRQNPKGLHLHLHVDEATGAVETRFTPGSEHIGFE